jgi:hypothetical protein
VPAFVWQALCEVTHVCVCSIATSGDSATVAASHSLYSRLLQGVFAGLDDQLLTELVRCSAIFPAPAAKRTYATVGAFGADVNSNNRAVTPRARSAQVRRLACVQTCPGPKRMSSVQGMATAQLQLPSLLCSICVAAAVAALVQFSSALQNAAVHACFAVHITTFCSFQTFRCSLPANVNRTSRVAAPTAVTATPPCPH